MLMIVSVLVLFALVVIAAALSLPWMSERAFLYLEARMRLPGCVPEGISQMLVMASMRFWCLHLYARR